MKTVILLSISSDIGRELASRYLAEGWRVVGTYRSTPPALPEANVRLIQCDVADPASVEALATEVARTEEPWSFFISAVGVLDPIGSFMETDFSNWERSVSANSLGQLHALRALYPSRRKGEIVDAAFFAGGGTNGPFPNYSAYCLGKIALIKMCELIDDECADLNPFILGTGWVNTKIHQQTLGAGTGAGVNLDRTRTFLDEQKVGTTHDDIFGALEWCRKQGKTIVGGRNFSIVHDGWRNEGEPLRRRLEADRNLYKLRRSGN